MKELVFQLHLKFEAGTLPHRIDSQRVAGGTYRYTKRPHTGIDHTGGFTYTNLIGLRWGMVLVHVYADRCRQSPYPALLGRPSRHFLLDPSENHFWPELCRRLSSGPDTTENRFQIAVQTQWTTPGPRNQIVVCCKIWFSEVYILFCLSDIL